MSDKNKVDIDELKKSLLEFDFSESDLEDIFKSDDQEPISDGNDSVEDKSGTDGRKEFSELEKSIEDLRLQLKQKEEEFELEKSLDLNVGEESPDVNDISILFKSIAKGLNLRMNSIKDELAIEKAEKAELSKSIAEMNENLSNLNDMFLKFGKQNIGRKGFTSQNVLEKSIGEDEGRIPTLSITRDKQKIEKALEKMIEKSTDREETTKYENALIAYNSSGMSAALSGVREDIEKSEKIEIIK